MTPRECAQLQSLREIHLPESDLDAYRALGNAVNARVVEAIVQPLLAGLTPTLIKQLRPSASRSTKRTKETARPIGATA